MEGAMDAISKGQFDDVQKAHPLSAKAPKEHKEMDESKSVEIYEEEYAKRKEENSSSEMAACFIPMAAPVAVAAEETEERRRGEEALQRLRSADPLLYLSPSPELSKDARIASCFLFSSLVPLCPKPTPIDRLLADDSFDAEQIWWQIEQLSQPLLSFLHREVTRLKRNPPVQTPVVVADGGGAASAEIENSGTEEEDEGDESDGVEEEEDGEADEGEKRNDESNDEEEDDEDGEEEEERQEKGNGVEDQFLKIKELQEYLEKGEEEEYGLAARKSGKQKKQGPDDDEDDEYEEDDLELGDFDEDDDEDNDLTENARYEDFFGGKNKRGLKNDNGKRKSSSNDVESADGSEFMEMVDKLNDDEGREVLSAHQKELQKLRSKIEQLEKANLEPKVWTMQGEVTASKRPKNSALEVDLDFEHNVRPAPVITEEVTTSLEDMIRKRIIEGQFDDVQKAPPLPAKAPKEHKELDESKSKKGLAEIYEEEYATRTGLAPASLSASDVLKKEANILFKKLCSKLDALSHFHFAPKPVIEDMSIQTNVPALAMEEVAPLAVSDATMLAPEEIFKGEGDIKETAELTKEERKNRRAKKKRKFRAITSRRNRGTQNAVPNHVYGADQ